MTSNVGLSTPRGSGTSGYVQRNLSALKPSQLNKARGTAAPYSVGEAQGAKHRQRQPDKEILEHDRKRQVEIEVFELRDRLEDEGVDEDEIDEKCAALRKKLLAGETNTEVDGRRRGRAAQETSEREHWNQKRREIKNLKGWQTHELAEAKIDEMERFRKAVGISAEYEEGGHWKEKEERERKRAEQAAAALEGQEGSDSR